MAFGHLSWRAATLRQGLRTLEQCLDPVTAFAAAPGVLDALATRLPAQKNKEVYSFVVQDFSEQVGIVAPIGKEPLSRRQAAQKRHRAEIPTELASGHEEAERAALSISDGMRLGVHAALGSAD